VGRLVGVQFVGGLSVGPRAFITVLFTRVMRVQGGHVRHPWSDTAPLTVPDGIVRGAAC